MAFQSVLNRYLPSLQGCRDLIVTDLKKTPNTAILAEYLQGGKMFRALLAFMAADAVGGELAMMVPVASALELLHGASLIHDDIVDGAKERRGHPALHLQVGVVTIERAEVDIRVDDFNRTGRLDIRRRHHALAADLDPHRHRLL